MKKLLSLLLVAAMFLSTMGAALADSDSYTELVYSQTESGPIVGFTYKGVNTFRGVPYAQAKRYQAPEKPEPWAELRPCFNWGFVSYSPQNGPKDIKFTEFMTPSDNSWIQNDDCQNLNIWSPSMNAEDKLPVLVYLHGGDGNAQELVYYDGNNLAASGNLVFVTANHRESLLGTLDLSAYGEQYKYSAYSELQDIIAALQWIKDNIGNFGGDPQNVTIMGQSGGTWDVMDLMGTPSAKGLYHKAVMSSSPEVQEHLTTTHQETQADAEKLVQALGLTAETIDQINEIPYEMLNAAASELGLNWGAARPVESEFFVDFPFTPDGEIETNLDVPMMFTDTYGETHDNLAGMILGYGYENLHKPEVSDEKIMELLTARYGENTDKVIEMYNAAYPGRDLFYALYVSTYRSAGDLYDIAQMRVANGGAPVYVAIYSYCFPLFGGTAPVHTNGDIPLVFNNIDMIPEHIAGDEEMARKVSTEASTALANFVHSGNPNGEGVPQWPAYDAEKGTTMFFDRVSEARSGLLEQEMLTFMAENWIK